MPRQARLDAPGTLHHVMLRGIERRAFVTDNADRHEFVSRLGTSAMQSRTSVYGWALLTNHAHLLLRSGPDGLPRLMRRFLTGYAQAYNRRHQRHGHLFQNRYKSIVCEEDRYFVELLRYIHLNPLRARLVRTLSELERHFKRIGALSLERAWSTVGGASGKLARAGVGAAMVRQNGRKCHTGLSRICSGGRGTRPAAGAGRRRAIGGGQWRRFEPCWHNG